MRLALQAAKNLQRRRAKLIKARHPKVGSRPIGLQSLRPAHSAKQEKWSDARHLSQELKFLPVWRHGR